MEKLEILMLGEYQTENAALGIMAAIFLREQCSFSLSEQTIRTGLKQAYWPGRFEIISENPRVVIDGAHNDEGITVLVHELKSRYQDKNIHIIFTALRDKKLDKMIERLDTAAAKITFVSFDFPRASSAKSLFDISRSKNKVENEDWRQAIREELSSIGENSILVITGSLYFISEVKPYLSKLMNRTAASI